MLSITIRAKHDGDFSQILSHLIIILDIFLTSDRIRLFMRLEEKRRRINRDAIGSISMSYTIISSNGLFRNIYNIYIT